ncbi:MAG: ATP-binding protein [Clostridia bacterium]|nr:ATP-binding protein [Clostridia bacterium]
MIQRESYLQKIRPFMHKDLVKVLSGIRRSGKSTLFKLIQQELLAQGIKPSQIYEINFESLSYVTASMMDVYRELIHFGQSQAGKSYIFLDEVQDLSEWERLVNSLRVDLDCDLYITGSNSKLLSSELATYLAGRYIEISVYPFSFQEVTELSQETCPEMTRQELFQHYLLWGGMPFIYANQLDAEASAAYLQDIFNSIVLKDIIARHSIRDVELFERILHYLMAQVGQPFSGASLAHYLKNEKRTLSQETLYNYIAYAQDACLLHLAPRADVIGKRMLQFQEKIYLADPGIRQAIYGNNQRDINQILENIVYLELLRRGYKVSIGKAGSREIDFVAESRNGRQYFQVAYLLADPTVVEREFSVLHTTPDSYPKFVLSLDTIDFSRDGVIHQNLIDFLIAPIYLEK